MSYVPFFSPTAMTAAASALVILRIPDCNGGFFIEPRDLAISGWLERRVCGHRPGADGGGEDEADSAAPDGAGKRHDRGGGVAGGRERVRWIGRRCVMGEGPMSWMCRTWRSGNGENPFPARDRPVIRPRLRPPSSARNFPRASMAGLRSPRPLGWNRRRCRSLA